MASPSLKKRFIVAEAPRNLRAWVLRVYKGIEDFFPVPKRTSIWEVQRVAQWKAVDAARERYVKKWEPIYGRFFVSSGKEVAGIYERTRTDAFIESYIKREFTPELKALYRRTYVDVGTAFLKMVRDGEFVTQKADVFDTVIGPYDILPFANWIDRTTGEKIVGVDRFTINQTKGIIESGIRGGRPIALIAKDIQNAFAFSDVRGQRIARTEVIAAANGATHFGVYKYHTTDGMTKTWFATGDKRTRPTHQKASGQVQPYLDPFQVGQSELLFPGDGSFGAAAKETIQCRCSCLYHLPKLSEGRTPRVPVPPEPVATPTAPKKPVRKPKVPKEPRSTGVPKNGEELRKRILEDQKAIELKDKIAAMRAEAQDLNSQYYKTAIHDRQGRLDIHKRTVKLLKDIPKEQAKLRKMYLKHMYQETAGNMEAVALNPWESPASLVKKANKQLEDINRIVGNLPELQDVKINVLKNRTKRAWADTSKGWNRISISSKTTDQTVFHEVGHIIEGNSAGLRDQIQDLYARRTAGEDFVRLKDLYPERAYKVTEITKRDKWMTDYMGKYYDGKDTELVSSALEYMSADPVRLATEDPELFDVVWNWFRGVRP